MEYRFVQDAPHSKEALVHAVNLWLRNVAPTKAKTGSVSRFTYAKPALKARPQPKAVGSTTQLYKVLAPSYDIFSSHQMRAVGRVTLQPGLHLEQLGELGKRSAHYFLLGRHDLLVVQDPSLFFSWKRLPFHWDRPLPSTMGKLIPPMAAPRISSPISGINVAASTLPLVMPVGDVASMSLTEKLLMAAVIGFERLPGKVGDELLAVWHKLNTPLGWSTMIAIVVALALFGEIIAVLLAATGAALAIYDLMTQVLDLFRQYYEAADNARTPADIRAAGELFGKAVAKGLLDIIDLFFSTRQTIKSVGRLSEMVAQRAYTPGFLLIWIEEVLQAWRRRMGGGNQLIPVPIAGELPRPRRPNPGSGHPGEALPGPKPRNLPTEGTGTGGKQGRRPTDDNLKGGKKKQRDKDYGVKDPNFWSWWHRDGKREYGGQDMTKEMMDEVYEDWLSRGKPTGRGDKLNKPNR
ncbi:hypothetical protein [Fibrella aquatilis]|uniref:Uncharacterized protein n=1 Tax=Fibrella aquatilis TaxID=2817059 RepID=A0A939G3P2_9BACT|nr:hypothetical protein [Fibrella aquatilis]MBO0930515.1 hypothetical protein [Fibrella aquatilis]